MGRILEVGFAGMQHHHEQLRLEKLKQRVAFEDNVDRRCSGRYIASSFALAKVRNFVEGMAEKWHAFGKKPLLGAEPETPPRSGGEKSRAVGAGIRVALPTDRTDVLVGSAITVVSVLRADSVTILRDFSGDPVGLGKRGDDVADQLRLADGTRMPTDHD